MPEAGWSTVSATLRELAARDLRRGPGVRPRLLAFAGEEPLVGIDLPTHGTASLSARLVEALALALPLGADRLALLVGGHARWSDDATAGSPVLVVLRVEARADGAAGPVPALVIPYARRGDGVTWHDGLRADDRAPSRLQRLLVAALDARSALASRPPDAVGRQARRLLRRGHGLRLPAPGGDDRLAVALLAAAGPDACARR